MKSWKACVRTWESQRERKILKLMSKVMTHKLHEWQKAKELLM